MKQAALVFMILLGMTVSGAVAADVDMYGNLAVGGSVTAASFLCSGGVPCFDPADISTGTANISISGNANTCTTAGSVPNAVLTTGSYADPSWITSLDVSKITGANPVGNGAITPANISFYDRVAIVATTGGDYNNPATAMSGSDTWCPSPTAAAPCLLKIMPGVYAVSTTAVEMKPYIDIEGSGERVTKITGTVNGAALPPTSATVKGAGNAELRFLTVENTGTGTYTAAVMADTVSDLSLLYVTLSTSGAENTRIGLSSFNSDITLKYVTATASGGATNYGIYFDAGSAAEPSTLMNMKAAASGGGGTTNYGIHMQGSPGPALSNVTVSASGGTTSRGIDTSGNADPTLTNVTVTASGAATNNIAIYNDSSSPTLTTVTATATNGTTTYGIQSVTSGTVRINHSVIKGTKSVVVGAAGVTTFVGNSQLDGAADNGGGTGLVCVGAYNATYGALGAGCL